MPKSDLIDRIFSVERNESGKRSFIVSTYEEFWRRYQDMLPAHRHHYEILREGLPCKLYFGTLSQSSLDSLSNYETGHK